jgi:hypothetical protein
MTPNNAGTAILGQSDADGKLPTSSPKRNRLAEEFLVAPRVDFMTYLTRSTLSEIHMIIMKVTVAMPESRDARGFVLEDYFSIMALPTEFGDLEPRRAIRPFPFTLQSNILK